jgi:L-lactate dehydrogenase
VSVAAVGEYGIHDVCLSLPCLVGSLGIVKVLELNLAPEEIEKLKQSAALLKEHLNELNL